MLRQSGSVAAQTVAVVRLPPVEVVSPSPLPRLGVPKDEVPANVQTATAADLERRHVLDLTAYLNGALGSVNLNELQSNPFQPDVNYRGSDPLFGLNTLGGALSVQTKDGIHDPGNSVEATAGSHRRASILFESGGSIAGGLDWFVTGNRFHERGWREVSPSGVSSDQPPRAAANARSCHSAPPNRRKIGCRE